VKKFLMNMIKWRPLAEDGRPTRIMWRLLDADLNVVGHTHGKLGHCDAGRAAAASSSADGAARQNTAEILGIIGVGRHGHQFPGRSDSQCGVLPGQLKTSCGPRAFLEVRRSR
jgi:hypothetical protein